MTTANSDVSEMTPYVPSNSTEFCEFSDDWCRHCARDKAMREGDPIDECDDNERCEILTAAFFGQIKEWVEDADGPRCTAFVPAGEKIPEIDTNTIPLF